MSNSDRRNSSRQSQDIDENLYYEEEPEYALPHNGLTRALVIGFVGGVIALAISIGIVLSHASLFNEGARLGDRMPLEVAQSIALWSFIGVVADIVLAFVVGIFVGRTVVKRVWGFWAGVVVGIVVQLGIFIAQYIPGYAGVMGVINNTATTNLIQHTMGFVVPLFLYGLFGGLLSLWGVAIMTRKHPLTRSSSDKKHG